MPISKQDCSVAGENEKFKGKSEDYKDLENLTEIEPFNLSKKRNSGADFTVCLLS